MFSCGNCTRQLTWLISLNQLQNMQVSMCFGFILEAPYMTVYLLLALSIRNESFVFETCFASNRSPYVKAEFWHGILF